MAKLLTMYYCYYVDYFTTMVLIICYSDVKLCLDPRKHIRLANGTVHIIQGSAKRATIQIRQEMFRTCKLTKSLIYRIGTLNQKNMKLKTKTDKRRTSCSDHDHWHKKMPLLFVSRFVHQGLGGKLVINYFKDPNYRYLRRVATISCEIGDTRFDQH